MKFWLSILILATLSFNSFACPIILSNPHNHSCFSAGIFNSANTDLTSTYNKIFIPFLIIAFVFFTLTIFKSKLKTLLIDFKSLIRKLLFWIAITFHSPPALI